MTLYILLSLNHGLLLRLQSVDVFQMLDDIALLGKFRGAVCNRADELLIEMLSHVVLQASAASIDFVTPLVRTGPDPGSISSVFSTILLWTRGRSQSFMVVANRRRFRSFLIRFRSRDGFLDGLFGSNRPDWF